MALEELRSTISRLPRILQRIFVNDIAAGCVGITCLALGVYIRHSNRLGDFKDGLGALCDALVIAAILKVTVDPILKRELAKDAAKDVFLYAFGYSLPPKLREFVNDLVLETKIVRRGCLLKWDIAPKDGDPRHLAVNLTASFFVMNFSGSDLPYQHKVFSWKENSEDVGCIKRMFCNAKEPRTGYSNEANALVSDRDGFMKGKEITVAAHTKEDDYHYEMGAVYYAEAEQPGLDQFTIMEPTLEITATVTVHDTLNHLVFSVVPDLSETRDRENYKTPYRDNESHRLQCSWKLDRVFVPNERVLIRWKQKDLPTLSLTPVA